MSVRTNRRRFGFEALERRETPTAGLGGGVHALAHVKPLTFKGNGTIQLDTSAGTGTITGTSTLLGQFTGTLNQNTVTLTGTDGAQLDLNSAAKLGKPHKGVESLNAKFKVTGGTNEFSNAKGSGTITGKLTVATGTLTFKVNGKVTE